MLVDSVIMFNDTVSAFVNNNEKQKLIFVSEMVAQVFSNTFVQYTNSKKIKDYGMTQNNNFKYSYWILADQFSSVK